ncbi:unannotated protein [freshwater metagenome]|uniref:Unannotated protein n=1 Tax=freshwater metagenome TaxID=449393 RepID=A0A6J7DL06_9ZZZZ
MALGAENVESAGSNNLFGFNRHFGLHRGEHFVPARFEFFGIFGRVETRLVEFGYRDEFGVSAEHDVGTATRHVGGNRDRTKASSFGDNGGFTRVVLCVEHLVLDSTLRQKL